MCLSASALSCMFLVQGLPSLHDGESATFLIGTAAPSALVQPLSVQLARCRNGPTPGPLFKNWLFDGLAYGFRIGFNRSSRLVAAKQNLPSAKLQESVVSEYLRKELSLSCFTGPLSKAGIHLNPVGVISKGHTPNMWWVITDLSSPVTPQVDPSSPIGPASLGSHMGGEGVL